MALAAPGRQLPVPGGALRAQGLHSLRSLWLPASRAAGSAELPALASACTPRSGRLLAAAISASLGILAAKRRRKRVSTLRRIAVEGITMPAALNDTSLMLGSVLGLDVERPLQVLTTLAGAILCHEAGHYLCASSVGLPAVEFSIGFGPQLWSSSEPETDPEPAEPDESIEFKDAEDDQIRLARVGGKIDVLANEKLMWSGSPTLSDDGTLECGGSGTCQVPSETRDEVRRMLDTASEALLAAAGSEGTEFSLRLLPIGGYVRFNELKCVKLKDGTFASQLDALSTPAQLWVYAGGVLANMVTAWTSLFAGALTSGIPENKPLPGIRVESVGEDAFLRTGLNAKDVLLRIGELDLHAPGQSVKATVEYIKSLPDAPVSLQLERAGRELLLNVQPLTDPQTGLRKLGVMINSNTERVMVKGNDATEAAGLASATIQRLLTEQIEALQGLVSFSGSSAEIVGPVGMLKQGSDLTADQGLVGLGMFFISVNLNLALLNALPVPALDGGKAAFAIAGELLGKPVDEKKKQDVEYVFILLTVVALFCLSVKDIGKLFKL
eukprot:TRINITY_DN66259_c0_g1_i1.p1 TRINITY_DN66259_c0_g1~~TRINITY_DN66259_c0_g1_i1.p1  ORF type:complete len:555 (+),score=109.40 TRINITY_DN66259_c0_g1_i1:44-1708(+)